MIPYATPEQLAEFDPFPDGLPDNAESLLRAATLLVRHATRFDVYDTDPTGRPTEPDVIGALRDATCQQALAWIKANLDPAAPAAGPRVSSSSIAGASVDYDTALTAAEERELLTALCPLADLTLADAGLGGRGITVW